MNIELLYSAVDLVRASGHRSNAREAAFLRTYPILLATARIPGADAIETLLRSASLVYAWMPSPLHLDMSQLEHAAASLAMASGEAPLIAAEVIEPIADCLGSLIGAAKVLHLSSPAVYPLWDARVERFRLQDEPSSYHMSQTRNYLSFVQEVQEVAAHPLFLTFHNEYCTAYQARLQRLQIPAYPLTETRVIESAAAELAGQ
ncbi:hypothetical protein G3480_05160 [Thiorhodococcus mannitoliphagus]|uniref:Uncharacterized protein n=1 Tax=Thiorhodococcus mannitoliphagus TaxID=329406 RepID=A0A6P1DNX8_9GAMM|nr:hypothetical protein [Thiorhodococcus mannitoliphagus]NEX19708.1 hypothetical protein [Thiorhodococcus mannitoliphagus]